MIMKKKLKTFYRNNNIASNYRIMIYNRETMYYMQFLPSYTNFINFVYNVKFESDSTGFPFNFTKNSDRHYLSKYLPPIISGGLGETRHVELVKFAVIGF